MTVIPLSFVLLIAAVMFLVGVIVAQTAANNAIDDWLDEQEPYAPARDAYTDRLLEGLRKR